MSNRTFQVVLISFLILLFAFMAIKDSKGNSEVIKDENTMVVFYKPGCSACERAKKYINNDLKEKKPDLKVEYHNLTEKAEMDLLNAYLEEYKVTEEQLLIPIIFIGENYQIGYEEGIQLEDASPEYINTWFGRVNILELSLPALAITLGLVDGFNPCAMWVLVYMISLIIGLKDKRKIWLIVGTFVLASAVLYYLFMTAFLSVFLYIGYLRILELLIGCFAIYVGVLSIKNANKAACKVETVDSKEKTKGRIRHLVESEVTLMTVLGIIVLAFVVNSMEFVCSAALPAIFTGVLAQAKLSMIEYHSYILLYVFFFMLNEFIIFGTAAFAVDYYVGDRLIGPLRLIGGAVLLGLGVIMVLFPEFLK